MRTEDAPHAQAKTPPSQPNPALKSLAGPVGEWEMELSNAAFLRGSVGSFLYVKEVICPSERVDGIIRRGRATFS